MSEVLKFEPSLNVSRLCVMVDIVNDSVLEEEQTFFLVLSTADPTITVQEDPAVVLIMDNDGNVWLFLVVFYKVGILSNEVDYLQQLTQKSIFSMLPVSSFYMQLCYSLNIHHCHKSLQ